MKATDDSQLQIAHSQSQGITWSHTSCHYGSLTANDSEPGADARDRQTARTGPKARRFESVTFSLKDSTATLTHWHGTCNWQPVTA